MKPKRTCTTPAGASECLRYERERAAIQREIDRLQEVGGHEGEQLQELLVRKYDLIQRIEGLI